MDSLLQIAVSQALLFFSVGFLILLVVGIQTIYLKIVGEGIRCSFCNKKITEKVAIDDNENSITSFVGSNECHYCSQKCHDEMANKYRR